MGIAERVCGDGMRQVIEGQASRRHFLSTLLGLGLSGPFIARRLAAAPRAVPGGRAAQAPMTPTKRGGGGTLRLLWWQAPTLLNPHLAAGLKDTDASSVVYESLAAFNPDGDLVPVLAAEIPSVDNGALPTDGSTVTWRLKRGVVWHDGQPCTADDVLFTWEYAADPATAAVTRGSYENIRRIDKLDDHTVKVVFKEPTPFWYDAFCGMRHAILPKHLLAEYTGQNSRNAPYNLKPVGTGPYQIIDFKPGDVARFEINSHYHVPNRPFFDSVELKGGGDATSAARAVIQTGEYDFAWNMQVEKDVLERLDRQEGRGRFHISPGSAVEIIWVNRTDPWTEVDGERSSIKVSHPFFSDLRVRQALALTIDRQTIAEQLYGPAGQPTSNYLVSPPRFHFPKTRWEVNLGRAAQLLEQAGWIRGSDGIRTKNGRRLKLLYQTSTNPVRQKTQAIVKHGLQQVGIEVELKTVAPNVYFASDPGNPDTLFHFYADLQMDMPPARSVDPQARMRSFVSWDLAQKADNWTGRNITRWINTEYDHLWQQAATELDPGKRAELFIRVNDLIIGDVVVIPLIWRHGVDAVSHQLRGIQPGPWDTRLWDLAYWYRQV
jgi:peptide/nickel transport system substrate-binding protein